MSPKIAIFIFIFYITANCGLCAKNTFKIGAIFGENESDKESTFIKSIDEINSKRHKSEIKLQPLIRHINLEDAFNAMTATCSLIEKGVVAILGPSNELSYKIIQSICDDKDIPLIVIRDDNEPVTSVINLYPSKEALIRTYTDILDAWAYKDFIILYENNESLKRIDDLIGIYYTKKNKVVARELDKFNTGNYRPVLKDVAKSGATHFVLDCSIQVLEEVLRQAQQVNLMSDKYNFFVTNLDLCSLDLSQYQYSDVNITGIRLVDLESNVISNLPLDQPSIETDILRAFRERLENLLVKDSVVMLYEALKQLPKNSLRRPMDCRSTDRWPFGTTMTNSIQNMQHLGLSGLIRFDTKGHRSNFSLDVIELREGGIIKVGNWDFFKGLTVDRIEQKIEEVDRRSLKNKSFKVLISLIKPFAIYKSTSEALTGNDQFEGYAIDLIHELSLLEGFNYTFMIQADQDNGGYNKATKQWSGMIGAIINGTAELAIADLTITSERQEFVDFAAPFMTLGISILYHKPTKAPPSFFSFADPFALEVWELLAISFFSVSILFYILGRICSSEWSNPYPCVEEPEFLVNQLSLRNCFWFTVGSLMQQGSDIGPVAVSTRMVAAVWWFFTLIMVSSYTANLAAFLTTEKPQPHFTNIYELVQNADKYGISFGAKKVGSTINFFRDKKHIYEYGYIYKYMKDHKDTVLVADQTDGVERAERENHAFFMEMTTIEYEIQRRCNLTAVGDLLDEKSYGIAMKKNSTYRNIFSRAILNLQQNGKLTELKRRWWEEKRGGGLCSGEGDSSESRALGWKNVSGVFWVTIAGMISSLLMVFIELILHVVKESVKTKAPVKETIIQELKFYFNFSGMVKPVIRLQSKDDLRNSIDTEKSTED